MKNRKWIWIITILVGGLLTLISMCEWTDHVSWEHLDEFCYLDNKPEHGKAYDHCRSNLEVFQVVRGGVLVKLTENFKTQQIAEWKERHKYLDRFDRGINNDRMLFIETTYPYADGERLKSQYYEFVGNFTYQSVGDGSVTVRRFREHNCKMFRF